MPLVKQRQSLREFHLVTKFSEANHVAAATAAVTIEQALARIYQKAWLMIGMQRTQSH
jgi:hypothetical protein